MKNFFRHLIILTCLVFLLVLPFFVFAGTSIENLKKVGEDGGYTEATETSFSEFIGTAIAAFLSMLGVLFVVLMIYGGFKWMKASGREDDVKIAQDTIRRAIIGLVIVVSSYAIMAFVFDQLLSG